MSFILVNYMAFLMPAFLVLLSVVAVYFICFDGKRCRTVFKFSRCLLGRKWIPSSHPAHIPPGGEELLAFHRRIGEMLVEKRIITLEQLEEAVSEQHETGRLLGDILLSRRVVCEDELIQTLGMQLRISTREIDPYETPLELLRMLPREVAVLYSVFPVNFKNNKLTVAVYAIPGREELRRIEAAAGIPVELCLTTRNNLSFSIQRGYERLRDSDDTERPRLGQLLLDRGLITETQLFEALKKQRRTYSRLGDVLLDELFISCSALKMAFEDHAAFPCEYFGDFLVKRGDITSEQLRSAVDLQKTRFRSLGEILTEMELVTADILMSIILEVDGRKDQSRLSVDLLVDGLIVRPDTTENLCLR